MKSSLSAEFSFIFLCFNFVSGNIFDTDTQCAARLVPGQSVICVCNATHCDTISRIKPKIGSYVAYTSSEGGLRFRKTFGDLLYTCLERNYGTLHCAWPDTHLTGFYFSLLMIGPKKVMPLSQASLDTPVLELNPLILYQTIRGFGGSVTDSTGINWKNLEDPHLRQHLVNSYCSESGLEYNMLRLPMGGTDFSTRPYTYDDFPDDVMLSNFTLAQEDKEYKIPLIKACMEVATSPIKIVGSIWSPPAWMKTSNSLFLGFLKEEHYQTLANYFIKFLQKYNDFGIRIWAITTTNEPINGILFRTVPLNRLEWTVNDMGKWIVNNLGPTIRNSTYKHVKILGCDDQRLTIPLWFNILVQQHPAALEYLNGIAVHFYYDTFTPASQMTLALQNYPDKFIISTEACAGSDASADEKVILGSWSRAELYITDIIEDLNYNVAGWIDWNMCLNERGGPSHIDNRVDSPVIISADKQEFYKQPMFYAMGHISKFVPRGSRRIEVTEIMDILDLQNVAFLTPQNTIVVILYNKNKRRDIVLKLESQLAIIDLEPKSITTVEFPYESIP